MLASNSNFGILFRFFSTVTVVKVVIWGLKLVIEINIFLIFIIDFIDNSYKHLFYYLYDQIITWYKNLMRFDM